MTTINQNSSRLAAERNKVKKDSRNDLLIDLIVAPLTSNNQANLNIYVNVGGAA
jgi:hypothetical protein